MVTWAELRLQIREGILDDNPTDTSKRRFSDTKLLTYFGWALTRFASHTAVATATSFTEVSGTQVVMPSNVYGSLEDTAQVITGTGTSLVYHDPISRTKEVAPNSTGYLYYELPIRTINFKTTLTNETVRVNYFAYYNKPVNDTDIIGAPNWAFPALSYLVGAHAMAGLAVSRANIAQWAESPERGDPEDNPFRVQQQWFEEQYDNELRRQPKQMRNQYWRYNL